MILFFLGFIVFYTLVMVGLLTKWQVENYNVSLSVPPVSVIVPFRNEANILLKTLDSLRDLSADEIIFCNDHSEDKSCDIIQDYIFQYQLDHWKLIDSIGIGKKAAVTTAINESSHQFIYTTDADCIVSNEGLCHMLRYLQKPEIIMVCGPVTVFSGDTFFERYQIAEWASISLVTNYFFKIKKPLMCSAANMAYRKSAFNKVEGYKNNENVSSGDDEYLLKKITSKYGPECVFYTNHPDTVVYTLPTRKLALYFNQRGRWASKWKAHNQLSHAGSALFAFLVAGILASSVMLLECKVENIVFFVVFWLLKMGVDFWVLGQVMKTYRRKISFIDMIGVSVLHPLSVILIGVFSIFVKITWKGRVVITKA